MPSGSDAHENVKMSTEPQRPDGAARTRRDADEAALALRARSGDRDAFGELVERYADQARRVARAVLQDADDADDAAQDAFLAALVKLHQYDAQRPFGPWLMRIVSNAATDRRRRRTVRRAESLQEGLIAGGARPDAVAERAALNDRLRGALAQLPPRRSLAVTLFDVEGYSHAEIAEMLGIPEGTVRSEVFHARRRLRTLLADWREAE
jgi:RNA polymerase sigma-70 factor (ECF subfamily)